ncbi:hypothetical protein D3C71_79480 [compost metagenome]
MQSSPRPGVLVLRHPDSDTYYVEAAHDVQRLARDIEFELDHGQHACDPLQEAYNRHSEVQFLLLPCPTLRAAQEEARREKRELDRKTQLINDGTHNPQALVSYH